MQLQKKIEGVTYFFILLGLLSCSARKSGIQMSVSDVLIYDVNYGQKSQQLEIEILSRAPELIFNYRMIDNSKIAGKVVITADAMTSATEQDHIWDGSDKNLTNKTAIWLSSSVFTKIEAGEETIIPFRQGFTYHSPTFKVVNKTELEIHVNGKLQKLPVVYLEDTIGKGFKYWIWDNQTNPMILKMDIGWTMSLTQIIKP